MGDRFDLDEVLRARGPERYDLHREHLQLRPFLDCWLYMAHFRLVDIACKHGLHQHLTPNWIAGGSSASLL